MPLISPSTIVDASGLPVLPSNFETELFQHPSVSSWYTADSEYITSATQSTINRATTVLDRSPNANNLTAAFGQSFVWNSGLNADTDIGGATYLRSDDSTKGYVSPISPWPTGDHFKVFFFKANTPGANRFLQGGNNSVQLSTLDRVIANVGGSQQILTRDPSKWNLVIETWDAASGSVGLLINSRGFTSSASSANVAGTSSPIFGANTGIVTGATCNYRDWGTGTVDLRKSANAALLAVILDYFETMYGLDLGV